MNTIGNDTILNKTFNLNTVMFNSVRFVSQRHRLSTIGTTRTNPHKRDRVVWCSPLSMCSDCGNQVTTKQTPHSSYFPLYQDGKVLRL